jgi:SpoU rRNA methylase family enzyme
MSDRKQPVECQEKANCPGGKQGIAYRASTGIGGGIVGAAIGGLLGRRVGGSVGGVVGAVAGALVGRGTAQRVNATVEGVVGAAKTVADAVHHSVSGVGDALKDTVEQVTPSVIGVVDTVKDTVEQVKPSVIGVVDTVKDTVDQVKPSVIGVVDTVKDTVEQVKPSVVSAVDTVKDTVEQVKPSVVDAAKNVAEVINFSGNTENATYDDRIEPPDSSYSVNNEDNTPNETGEQVNPSTVYQVDTVKDLLEDFWDSKVNTSDVVEETLPETKKTKQFAEVGKFLIGAGVIALVGTILSLIPKQNLFAMKLQEPVRVESNQSIKRVSAAIPSAQLRKASIPNGWIFLGNVDNNPGAVSVGKPLSKDLQSTDSRVVPAAGAIVTVTVKPGVTLRQNRPQLPNFNYQEQKAISILKPQQKLKVLKVEFIPNPNTAQTTRVWAQVSKCCQ